MELETAASTIEVTDSGVLIRWSDGTRSRFHSLWLRHNCPAGHDHKTGIRTLSLTELNPDVFVLFAERDDNGDLGVEFSDGHETSFDFDWLRAHAHESHDRLGRARRIEHFRAGHTVDQFELPNVGSAAHCDLLEALARWGVAIVNDVPTDHAGVEALAALLAGGSGHGGALEDTALDDIAIKDIAIKDTVIEPEFWELSEEALGLGQDPHTATSYRYQPAGMSIMACVEASTTGGDVVLVDGFGIAEHFRDDDPDTFDLLSEVRIPFVHRSKNLTAHAPVITVDRDYEIAGVRFDEQSMAPLDVDLGRVDGYYRALIDFATAVNDPTRAIQLGLGPGQALIYDNHRVLLGRTTVGSTGGVHHVRTCSIERDVVHGRLRQLRQKLDRPDVDERFPSGSTG